MSKTYSVKINSKDKRSSRKKFEDRNNKSSRKKVLFTLLFIFLVIATGGFFLYKYASECEGDECGAFIKPIAATINPKLKRSEQGLTNMLLVGLDTRESNSGLLNTDTIILLTVDHKNQSTVMTSIPRDLWVTYTLPNGNVSSSKINSVYASGEYVEEGKGIETLTNVVENITGTEVHYYAKVTLKGFIEVVDRIGGVDIEVEEFYRDGYPDTELPPEMLAECVPYYHDGRYCIFTFEEGQNHLDGQMALIYSRMRILSPQGDFDRARRQQQVIEAVKDKILSTETFLDPGKLWDLYNILKDNIETSRITINDIRAALNLKDQINTEEIANVVLDPNLGNVPGKYIYRPTDFPDRGYYIEAKDKTYTQIQTLLENIRKFPGIYNEQPTISLYNATGNPVLEKDWMIELDEKNPIFQIRDLNRVIPNTQNQYEDVRIYKFTEEEKPESEEYLKEFFGVKEIINEFDDGTSNFRGEDYIVVVGPTYYHD